MSDLELYYIEKFKEAGFFVKNSLDFNLCDFANTVYFQHRPMKSRKFRFDFALIQSQIAIEIDGYWHSKVVNKINDEARDRIIRSLGWKILRLPKLIDSNRLSHSILYLLDL